jgi:membrane AbrB-like protein
LPFLMGGLLCTIGLTFLANSRSIALPYPKPLRTFFVALIGALIGSTVSPELARAAPNVSISLLAVAAYVGMAQCLGYFIFRTVGKYERVTALYAAMPGGLIEAVELGRKGGGDVFVLTLSHFLRVLFVVIIVPVLFWLVSGDVVGSAAGQGFERGVTGWQDLALIPAIALVGITAGRMLHLPAAHLIGPMVISATLHGTGLVSTIAPFWLLYVAQLFVGVALGAQLSGAVGSNYLTIIKTSLVSTSVMLCLSAIFALVLVNVTPLDFPALFLSLAPGGVSEMGLIALSLGISPVMVAAHHVFRIFLTVFIAAIASKNAARVRG